MKARAASMTLAMLVFCTSVFAWKDIAHFVSLPLIDGAAVYCAVNAFNKAQAPVTRAAAVTDLACLGINGTLGALKIFGPSDQAPTFRTIHRAMGFVTTAAAIFMSVALSTDENIKQEVNAPVRYVSYAHSALTVVPLVIFAF